MQDRSVLLPEPLGPMTAMTPASGSLAARPVAPWPWRVAMSRIVVDDGQAAGFGSFSRGSSAASLIDSQGSWVSLLAAPSVPSATRTPAATNDVTGATPL